MFDAGRLPTGDQGWAELLGYAMALGDLAEAPWLELKSRLPLDKSGRKRAGALLAREILGFGNRMPDEAERYLGGHAVILVGGGEGQVEGVEPIDGAELRPHIVRFLDTDGPGWDFRYFLHDGATVLAIIVDPPRWGTDAYLCQAQYTPGDGTSLTLRDGDIFVRHGASVRPANSADIRKLRSRAGRYFGALDFAPGLSLGFDRVDVDSVEDWYQRWVRQIVKERLDGLPSPPPPPPSTLELQGIGAIGSNVADWAMGTMRANVSRSVLSGLTYEERTEDEFRQEVQAWRSACDAAAPDVCLEFIAFHLADQHLTVTNPTAQHFEGVEVTLTLPAGTVLLNADAMEHCDHGQGQFRMTEVAPEPPVAWGQFAALGVIPRGPAIQNQQFSDVSDAFTDEGQVVTWTVGELRSGGAASSSSLVTIMVPPSTQDDIRVRWDLTASGVNQRFSGIAELRSRIPEGKSFGVRLPAEDE